MNNLLALGLFRVGNDSCDKVIVATATIRAMNSHGSILLANSVGLPSFLLSEPQANRKYCIKSGARRPYQCHVGCSPYSFIMNN